MFVLKDIKLKRNLRINYYKLFFKEKCQKIIRKIFYFSLKKFYNTTKNYLKK